MLDEPINWVNTNQGIVSILIFLLTLFLGWVSGIFASLRRRAKFKLSLLPGPTMCATFPTGQLQEGYEVHRTAISLYLNIANVGSGSASIENVSLGYHWHVQPFSLSWLRYRVFWFWLEHPTSTMDDFQYSFGEKVKFYPSLYQPSSISGDHADTFLEAGQSTNGVIYFEQPESWGGCFPSPHTGRTKVRVAVTDSFGSKHKRSFWIPFVSLEEAKKYNPSFGQTIPTFRSNTSPVPTSSTAQLNC